MAELAERLHEGEPEQRLQALLEAMELEDPSDPLVRDVARVLHDAHPGLRQAALDALGRFATRRRLTVDRSVLERAVELTRDPHAKVRAEAAAALALLAQDHDRSGHLFALRRLLGDEDETVRQEAAAALGDLRDHESTDRLAARLEDDSADVRFEAAFALATLGDSRGRPLLEGSLRRRARRLDAMKALGRLQDPAALPALDEWADRRFAAWVDRLTALATRYLLGHRDSAQLILQRTRARNREERSYALALIGTHEIREGASALRAVAEDPKDPLRELAVRALGDLRDSANREVLDRLASHADSPEHLRAEAHEALARLDTDRPAPGDG